MQNIILTVHLILALLLIGVVLLQRSEGGGLGMGGSGGAMAGRQAGNAMTRLTWFFAVAFLGTSLALTVLAARDAASVSVVDQLGATAPDTETGAETPVLPVPDLPPAPAGTDTQTGGAPLMLDAPLTPPPVE